MDTDEQIQEPPIKVDKEGFPIPQKSSIQLDDEGFPIPKNLKKKDGTSKTSPASPSASLDTPTPTVTPTSVSASKGSQSLHEAIFGSPAQEKALSDAPNYLDTRQKRDVTVGKKEKQEGEVENFLINPKVADVSEDKHSLLSKTEANLNRLSTTDSDKSAIHQKVTNFRNNFYNGSLTPEDIDLVHGSLEGVTPQQAADAINTKTKKLKELGDAPLKKGVESYLTALKNIYFKINNLKNGQITPGENRPQNQRELDAQLSSLETQKGFLQHSVTQIYNAQSDNAAKDIVGDIKSKFDGASWDEIFENPDKHYPLIDLSQSKSPIQYDPKSKTLTKDAQTWVRGQVDSYLNNHPNDIINSQTSGDIQTKQRNYPDVANKVIDYLNTVVPVENTHKTFKDDFVKQHPEAKGFVDHQDQIYNYFSKEHTSQADAYVKTNMDKQAVSTGNKYLGENGVITGNSEFVKIQHGYAEKVAAGTMTEDVARKQIQAEIQQNPVLKGLYNNYQKELGTIRENGKKMWSNFIVKGLSEIDPNTILNDDGTIGIKGLTKTESKKLISEYNDGLAKKTADVIHGQHKELGLQADERAKRLGSFFGSLTESSKDIAGSFSKFWFDKTGYGGDNVRAFQAGKAAEIPISASDEAKKWEYKGLSSLGDPSFYLSKVGGQLPYFAGAAAVGTLTEGEGLPEYASWLASAGVFDAQMALSTYNDVISGNMRDAQGNKLTEYDAAKAAANQFSETILPDALFMSINMGVLSRAKGIVKPSIGKEIAAGAKGAVVGAIPMSWQGYLSYANEQKAQGKTPDFWDYAQDGQFTKSLIDGIVGGGVIGLAHHASGYSKQTENWKRLVLNSEGEFKSNSLYNIGLQHEINGLGNQWRDSGKIKLATEDWKGRDAEKAEIQQLLQYSTALDRNIKGAGIDISNINGAYQAHNLALADLHDKWAKDNEGNKNLSTIYADQAKDFREQAKNVMEGKAKFHYLLDATNKPIFISEQSFKALDQEGKLKDWMDKGMIKEVIKNDDPEFAAIYKAKTESKEKPAEVKLDEDHVKTVVEALKGNRTNFSEAGENSFGIHLEDSKLHETLAKEIITQATEHPNIVRDMIGNDAFRLLKPIIEEHKNISSQLKSENDETKKTEKTKEAENVTGNGDADKANVTLGGSASPDYKKNIRDDYFQRTDFFTDAEKEKFKELEKKGNVDEIDRMIDKRREELKSGTTTVINPSENKPPQIVPLKKVEPSESIKPVTEKEPGDNNKTTISPDKDKGVTEKTPEEKIKEINENRKKELDEAHKPDVSLDFPKASDVTDKRVSDPILARRQLAGITRQHEKLKLLIECLWKVN